MPRPAITPEILLRAYAAGIFPMAETREAEDFHWVDPRRRGVLPLERFHISRSLARRIRRGGFEIRANGDFAAVVDACAERDETWINPPIHALYLALHDMGFAHSIEVMAGGRLIGGVFGITMGGAFFGESMFSRATDASKLALAFCVDRLRAGGFTLFDTQFLTPHLASLGGVEIARAEYHRRLADALHREATFLPAGYSPSAPSSSGVSTASGGS